MSPDSFHPDFGYGAAIDAGSSGSRIYLYRWRTKEGFHHVEREAIFSEEHTPGISDDHGIGIDMLQELVMSAKDALPSDVDPSSVPIYLGATAGMRIIDPSFEADVMSRIRSLLHASGFRFQDEWARTISGEEEGVYDWLVANYLKNNGDFPTPTTAYGALDLGGASTQISFPVPLHQPLHVEDNKFPLRIENVEYPLYTQSYLYYGVDQARMKHDKQLATQNNPCYPFGYRDSNSKLVGSSNWEQCLESVAKLFEQPPNCARKRKRCLNDGGMHQPPPIHNDQKFIAMSAFVYTYDFLGLNIGEETDDLNALNAKAQQVCRLPLRRQKAQYERRMEVRPNNRKTTKPEYQCFNAAFSYHLLSKGYGMPKQNTPIEIYYDINGTKVQWALGLMLVEANKLGSLFKERRELMQTDVLYHEMGETYMVIMLVSLAVLIAGAVYLPRRVRRSSSMQESCLPLIDPETMIEAFSPRKR